jgi:uncharacterized damage-inducible protein DinB
MEDLSYPIGRFSFPEVSTEDDRHDWTEEIAEAPAQLRAAVAGLTAAQIATPYRSGGWTVRQVVHHIPDSHMNAYVRFKLALTEDEPTIKPYDEGLWAKLPDTEVTPIETSLALLDALHGRWVELLKAMSPGDFQRRFLHPDAGVMTLEQYLALYAWHGRHHVAHITSLRERYGWK